MKKPDNFKRLIIFFLVIVFACGSLLLQACGEKEDKGDAQATGGGDSVEETTPAPTPEPTEPPTTTEKPPLKTEEILKWTFTEEEKMFRVASQTDNFRVEEGILKMTSNGGDPYIISINSNIGIDTADVDLIRFKVKNGAEGYNNQLFFTTSEDPNWSEAQSFKEQYWFSEGEDWEVLEYDTSDNDLWVGTIKCIRFDYLTEEGDFEIEYMTFEKIVK